jgi:hypothetical protein
MKSIERHVADEVLHKAHFVSPDRQGCCARRAVHCLSASLKPATASLEVWALDSGALSCSRGGQNHWIVKLPGCSQRLQSIFACLSALLTSALASPRCSTRCSASSHNPSGAVEVSVGPKEFALMIPDR